MIKSVGIKSVLLSGGLLGALGLLSPELHAQDMAADVLRCGAMTDDGARLRCFDALLPEASKSEEQRLAEAEAKAEREFGLTAAQRSEKIKREHPDKKERRRIAHEENLRVEAAIADLDISPYGTVFVLDNGQAWQTTSFGSMNTVPHIGQKVTVESGPLGGYRLTLEGKTREVGVKRVK